MKINILDMDRIIEVNKLQEVTSPRLFSSKMTYDPDGILSSDIFGVGKSDRRNTFAYIKLRRKFIHPHIYAKVLKGGMITSIPYLVSGQRRYTVRNGLIVEDPDGWTGIQSLYDHWNEIDWSKSKSANTVNKTLLQSCPRDMLFLDKILVVPPAYRDVMIAGTVDSSDHVNELNDLYVRLIRSVAQLSEGGLFARTQYATQMRIQQTLVDIMNYFKNQVSRKQGLIRKNLLGKSVDYGVRSVISAPTYDHERIEDNIVDMQHTALPISECCSTFYPFIESWLKTFFTREIINNPNLVTFYDQEHKREITASLKDPEIQFSDKAIRKMINDYTLNPDNRFKVIKVAVIPPTENAAPVQATMVLKGKVILPNDTTALMNRAMTVTDILYLACVDVCEKRHVMVSRYPVGTDKGIYFNKIRVQSTAKHVKLIFNGREYPFYPDIDLKTDRDHVGVQFIDTLVMSNSHLDGMGADYDGDQVSVRGIWSDEANLEADQIMTSKMSALNIDGSNSKSVSKEVCNSLYELTKIGPNAKVVPDADQKRYLGLEPDDITRTLLVDMFADMVDNSKGENKAGKRKARHQTWDKMTVPANYYYQGQPKINTTVGRFIANKFMLQASGCIEAVKFVDGVLHKGGIGDIDSKVGDLLLKDHIGRGQFDSYIDHRDTLGYWLNGFLAHTISERMLRPLKEVEQKKEELCKKYEKELAAGNIDVMTQISDELVAYAKEILKDDPGMDLYLSGDLDFGNNYKNNAIVKGAVANKITGEFDFIGTSFMDGIDVKDIPAHANSILSSQYPASIATADAGYLGKKLLALLQMMEIDEPGTDCGTKQLIPLKITPGNKNMVLYTWIDNGHGQLIMITKENVSQYVGKTVMMRSPMTCTSTKICSKCAGQLFYMLGAKYAGLFSTQISHADLNLALKAKHNSLINLFTIDPNTLIEDV